MYRNGNARCYSAWETLVNVKSILMSVVTMRDASSTTTFCYVGGHNSAAYNYTSVVWQYVRHINPRGYSRDISRYLLVVSTYMYGSPASWGTSYENGYVSYSSVY